MYSLLDLKLHSSNWSLQNTVTIELLPKVTLKSVLPFSIVTIDFKNAALFFFVLQISIRS